MMYQLKIYDADNENIFDEVDGGIECIEEEQAQSLIERFGEYDDLMMLETEEPSWADLDADPSEMSAFAREIDIAPEMLSYIDDVTSAPDKYSTVPFSIFSYED